MDIALLCTHLLSDTITLGWDVRRRKITPGAEIDANVEWIKQCCVMISWLSFQLIASQVDMKKDSVWQIVTDYLKLFEWDLTF